VGKERFVDKFATLLKHLTTAWSSNQHSCEVPIY